MKFRSHVARPFDMDDPWNRAIIVLVVLAGVTGAFLTVGYDRHLLLAIRAGGITFLGWALARELDPDRQASAIVAAVLGGAWALVGLPVALLPFAGLLMTSRLLVETTGRRPLAADLVAMASLATVVSFTSLGWAMGFGLAISIYIDDRIAGEHNRQALLAAIAGAVGSSALATLTDVLRESVPSVHPLLAASFGVLALLSVLREPAEPVSFVDSRNKRFLRADRLHAGRAAAGVLLFVGALVSGETASAVVPMAAVVAISMASTEVERIRRALLRN